ncbi:MAG: LLM class flavin-dependent oxidoreductase [Rhodospirillaceae bacterium]|nr:MAG: LLM class flavin-dependent oxidoreductase [Rhodospirillaceae bacterium]
MKKRLTFGYLYDFRNPPQWRKPWAELYAETLEFIALTESLGFEGAWVPEHHDSEDGYVPSPLIALAAIAARTKTIKIGSAIALTPLYHPVRFAEDCALVDILSNGRLEMAVAVGYRRHETDAYGVNYSTRGARTDEFLEIVRRLWAGETVTHESAHFNIKNASIMPRPIHGQVPLYIGGFSDKALERAAKYGDGFHGEASAYDRYLEKVLALGKEPAAARLRTLNLFFVVAKDPEKARHELAPYLHYVNNAYGQWLREDQHAASVGYDALFKPMTLEAFEASGTMRILTPSQAIDTLERLRARVPIEHFAMLAPAGLPLSKCAEYAEVFAKEVIPAFR